PQLAVDARVDTGEQPDRGAGLGEERRIEGGEVAQKLAPERDQHDARRFAPDGRELLDEVRQLAEVLAARPDEAGGDARALAGREVQGGVRPDAVGRELQELVEYLASHDTPRAG